MKYIKRLLVILGIIIALLIMLATPALAIGNPTSITFGTVSPYNMYQVFCNVLSTGDMLVASLPYIHYDGGDPTDYTGKQAFSFQLLSTDETTVLFQTPVVDYEDTIIGIYLTASQVTTAGISQSGSYWLRLAPNPALFTPTEGTNQKSAQLSASDWITTTLGNTQTYLRQWCINRALELQTLDAPTGGYTVYVNGVQYLNTLATQIFIAGIPGLDQMCPTLFQSSSSGIQLSIPANSYSTGTVSGTSGTPNVTGSGTLWTTITATDEFISIAGDSNNYQISSITDDTHLVLKSNLQTSPSGAGYTISLTTAYAGTKSAQNTWGGVITGGLNNLGTWLHVGQTGAGIIVMMGITIAMCMVVYNRFHSAIAVEVIAIFLPVLGIYFGIMPMAVGLIITVGIAVIGLYYIFTRGIL